MNKFKLNRKQKLAFIVFDSGSYKFYLRFNKPSAHKTKLKKTQQQQQQHLSKKFDLQTNFYFSKIDNKNNKSLIDFDWIHLVPKSKYYLISSICSLVKCLTKNDALIFNSKLIQFAENTKHFSFQVKEELVFILLIIKRGV
jgi:hypothetical protein